MLGAEGPGEGPESKGEGVSGGGGRPGWYLLLPG